MDIIIDSLINIDDIKEVDYHGDVYALKIENDPSFCLSDGILSANCDLPDIDLDFEDIKRPLIRKHLEECCQEVQEVLRSGSILQPMRYSTSHYILDHYSL